MVLPASDDTKRVYLVKYTNEVQVSIQTDLSSMHQARLLPNPFKNFVQLRTTPDAEQMLQIQIFDGQGKKVYQSDVDAQHADLQLDHLHRGVYFFKVFLENDQQFTSKMIRY